MTDTQQETPSSPTPPSKEQLEKLYELAIANRNREIDLFWSRSLFFWGFIASAFVAYGVLATSDADNIDLKIFAIACLGFLSSFAWSLANRGSKRWQEHWETIVAEREVEYSSVLMFGKPSLRDFKVPFGSAPFSVSKLATGLSDATTCIWFLLALSSLSVADSLRSIILAGFLAGVAVTFAFAFFYEGRSS